MVQIYISQVCMHIYIYIYIHKQHFPLNPITSYFSVKDCESASSLTRDVTVFPKQTAIAVLGSEQHPYTYFPPCAFSSPYVFSSRPYHQFSLAVTLSVYKFPFSFACISSSGFKLLPGPRNWQLVDCVI